MSDPRAPIVWGDPRLTFELRSSSAVVRRAVADAISPWRREPAGRTIPFVVGEGARAGTWEVTVGGDEARPVEGPPERLALWIEREAVQRLWDDPGEDLAFHGAIVERAGSGLLLVGPGRAGKSTLAAALGGRGWRVLGDDVALVDAAGRARSAPRRAALREGSRALLGDRFWTGAAAGGGSAPTREGIAFHATGAGRPGSSRTVPLRAIVFLERRGADPGAARAAPLAPGATLLALVPYGHAVGARGLGAALSSTRPLAATIPAFDLARGPLDAMAEAIEALPPWAAPAETRARTLAIMVTRRCTMACAHCSVESHPRVEGDDPTVEEIEGWVRDAAAAGVGEVLMTGGEPMMRRDAVLAALRACRRAGIRGRVATNGFWAKSREAAGRRLEELVEAGLTRLSVSFDRYHADFQGPEPVLHVAAAAAERGMDIDVTVTRAADDADLEAWVAPFRALANVRLRFYDVEPVGLARAFPPEALRDEAEGFCSSCAFPAITDDGRLTACNGPAYFAPEGHPLHLGRVRETPLAELLEAHARDPVLETIRTFGPARLRAELRATPGFEAFPFRDRYAGMCDLCHHVTGDREAVAALRARLAEPRARAARAAARAVIAGERRPGGSLHRDTANGPGVWRLLLEAAPTERWRGEAARVLGRADLDWNRLADDAVRCGLARPLLPAIADPAVRRWAPTFFARRLAEAAAVDARREAVQRAVLADLDAALGALGARGVLLKGAARVAARADGDAAHATGDVDLLVPPAVAAPLRAALLRTGAAGDPAAARTGPHHLAAVSLRGVPVEIHTRIMPVTWGLPESAMTARAVPAGPGFLHLDALDAEGRLLHALVHATAHLYVRGVRVAWDARALLAGRPALDWDRLADWVAALASPRAFWVPARVLAADLGVPFPAGFLERAPDDPRQARLETIARARWYRAREGAYELNPFSKTAVLLLHHDRWSGRARHLADLFGAEARESRRSAARAGRGAGLPSELRDALADWRRYRRAVAASGAGRSR